jgi:hypothetical protein
MQESNPGLPGALPLSRRVLPNMMAERYNIEIVMSLEELRSNVTVWVGKIWNWDQQSHCYCKS